MLVITHRTYAYNIVNRVINNKVDCALLFLLNIISVLLAPRYDVLHLRANKIL